MSYNNSIKLIIVSAPSGAGKTTLVHYLLSEIEDLEFSISCTTRAKRGHEVDGKDYHFISVAEFQEKIKQQAFIEYEEVYKDLWYGTLRSEIGRIADKDHHVIFDIDVEGGLNIKKQYPQSLAIFITPPSVEVLEERLKKRSTENKEALEKRLTKVQKELTYQSLFDVIIVNDDLEISKQEILTEVKNYLEA